MNYNLLLNPKTFQIEEGDIEGNYCKRLIDKWTPQLEKKMLEAFIQLYYNEMYESWGPEDEEKKKEYWPKINSPMELIKHIGTEVRLYALKDAIYAKSKNGKCSYELQDIPICVILQLNCPWEEEHGWAAVFIDEKFVKVSRDIVNCVWLD